MNSKNAKNKIKIIKNVIIILLIAVIIFSMKDVYYYQTKKFNGDEIVQYSKDFIKEHCTPVELTNYSGADYPWWSEKDGIIYFNACCTTGIWLMFKNTLDIDLYQYDFDGWCRKLEGKMSNSKYWEKIESVEDIQPGDILINKRHTEMYAGNNENINFGNSPHSGIIQKGPNAENFDSIYRFKFEEKIKVYNTNKILIILFSVIAIFLTEISYLIYAKRHKRKTC